MTTTEASQFFTVSRELFLEAVSSDPTSRAAADETASHRLGVVTATV